MLPWFHMQLQGGVKVFQKFFNAASVTTTLNLSTRLPSSQLHSQSSPRMATPTLEHDEAEDRKEEPVWCQKDDVLLGRIQSTATAQEWLGDELQQVRAMLDGLPGFESSLSALAKAEKAASEVTQALRQCKAEAELVSKPSSKSAVGAVRVFGIAELVEEIFSHLPAQDILSATQTQRALSRVVSGSTKLKQRLGLEPNKSGFWYSPFAGWCTDLVQCKVEDPNKSWCRSEDCDKVTIDLDILTHTLPRIGSRWRKMLICSPPIFEMRVELCCCSQSRASQPLKVADGGITMGHIHDHAAKLIAEHRLCPFAGYHALDDKGMVEVCPSFHAKVQLQPNDPIMVQYDQTNNYRPRQSPSETTQHLTDERVMTLSAYTDAKLAGEHLSLPNKPLQANVLSLQCRRRNPNS